MTENSFIQKEEGVRSKDGFRIAVKESRICVCIFTYGKTDSSWMAEKHRHNMEKWWRKKTKQQQMNHSLLPSEPHDIKAHRNGVKWWHWFCQPQLLRVCFSNCRDAVSLVSNKDFKNDWKVKAVLCSEVINRIIRSVMKCLCYLA